MKFIELLEKEYHSVMCGIAGFIDNRGIDVSSANEIGREMINAIAHRGPMVREFGLMLVKGSCLPTEGYR